MSSTTGQRPDTSDRRAVRAYLDTLTAPRARRADPARLQARLDEVERALADPTVRSVTRLELVQRRNNLRRTLDAPPPDRADAAACEAAFVAAAARYGARKGITWAAWRDVGVPAAVLKRAGVPRGRTAPVPAE